MAATFKVTDQRSMERLTAFLSRLNLEKPWRIEIEPYRKKRSLEQNNLYHKWVGLIASETGNSHDAVHEWLKDEFLPPRMVEINGAVKQYRPTTTVLKVNEMSDYMTKVYAWATSELGMYLPTPEMMHEHAA